MKKLVKKLKKAGQKVSRKAGKERNKADPVEQLEDRYRELQEMLSAKRKTGADTSLAEIELKTIPADIKMYQAMKDNKIKKKITQKISRLKKELKI